MVNYIRNVHRQSGQRTAAAVQIRVILFGILYRQGVSGLQLGSILYIGMYAGAALDSSFGFNIGLCLFLHLLLFVFGHAIEIFGVVVIIINVDCI